MKTKILIAIISLIIIVLFIPTKKDEIINEKSKSIIVAQKVQIKEIKEKDFIQTIKVFARSKSDQNIDLKSESNAKIKKIEKKEGDIVQKGEVIIKLNIDNLNKELDYLKERRRELIIEKEGAQKLLNNNNISEFEMAKINTSIKRNHADINNIILEIEKRTIKSPINGRIDVINYEEGEYITTGNNLAKVISSANKIEAYINTNELKNIKLNQNIKFNNKKGKITYISKEISDTNNTVKIEATLIKELQFTNYPSDMIIETNNIKAMKIPSSSVILNDDGKLEIFYVENEKAIKANIEIIKNEGDYLWIKPIKNNINLVIVGQFYLENDDSVIAEEAML